MRRWISEVLDDAMLPFLKTCSPGYNRRLPPFRPAGDCDIAALSAIQAPEDMVLTPEPAWRGWKVDRFQFTSPIDSCDPEDKTVTGRLITSDPKAPWVLIVPGYAAGALWPHGFGIYQDMQGRALAERGLNAALICTPFHFSRKRPGCISGEGFFSPDLSRTQAAVQQAAADAIALLRCLKGQFGARVGIWGTSLGGCISGLVCTQLPDLSAAVLMEPLDNPGTPIAVLPGSEEIRSALALAGVPAQEVPGQLACVAPSSYTPAIPTDCILFVTPLWDRVVPAQFQEALWEAWGRPQRIVRPAGHVVLAANRPVADEVATFLARKLHDPPH